ncbi:uncharacterized protein [Typha angustifolia]|uniref:uncharacterized protein n=1 Tax=Typha angustifolia TaxID=59011 RepID=UPI003C2DE4FA
MRKLLLPLSSSSSSTSSSSTSSCRFRLLSTSVSPISDSDYHLAELRRLLPLLLSSDHHSTAFSLLSTVLLLRPPLASLPISTIVSHLSSHSDLAPSLALLTTLRHHPLRPSPLPFASPLVSSFFSNRRPKDAAKVFFWLCREDSPCRPDAETYRVAVEGFCWHGRMVDALKAVKEMVSDGVAVGEVLRKELCKGLMQEARIEEAWEVEEALKGVEKEGGKDGKVVEVLERLIRVWEE